MKYDPWKIEEEDFDGMTKREMFEEWWKTQDLSDIPPEIQSVWADGCFVVWQAYDKIARGTEHVTVEDGQIAREVLEEKDDKRKSVD